MTTPAVAPQPAGGVEAARNRAAAVAATLAVVLLGYMLSRQHGTFDVLASELLVPLLLLLVLLVCRVRIGPTVPVWALTAFGGAAVLGQSALLLSVLPRTMDAAGGVHRLAAFDAPALLLAAGGLLLVLGRGRWRWAALVAAVGFAWVCVAAMRYFPPPFCDVFVVQQDASAALLHGRDPYAMTFPNIYGPDTRLYVPGLLGPDRTRTSFGFPYPPLTLFTVCGSWLLGGDVRYAHVAALAVTFAVLALMEAGPLAGLACGLLATSSELWRIVYTSFTEPLLLPWLALTAWAMAKRRPVTAAVFFGLFLASKQYCVIFAPLALFLLPTPFAWRKAAGVFAAVVATVGVVTLPLVLVNPKAFWFSAVTAQLMQPFRYESMSISALLANTNLEYVDAPPVWSMYLIWPTYGLIGWRFRRTPAGLMAAVALLTTVFFAFNKQAIMNYYLLVLGALAVCVAHVPLTCPDAARGTPPIA